MRCSACGNNANEYGLDGHENPTPFCSSCLEPLLGVTMFGRVEIDNPMFGYWRKIYGRKDGPAEAGGLT